MLILLNDSVIISHEMISKAERLGESVSVHISGDPHCTYFVSDRWGRFWSLLKTLARSE